MQTETLWALSNIGFDAFGRKFPGFSNLDGRRDLIVEPRAARQLTLRAGDLLSFFPEADPYTAKILAFDKEGRDASEKLGLTEKKSPFDFTEISAQRLTGWIAANGGDATAPHMAATVEVLNEPIILRAAADCVVWVLNPISQDKLTFVESSSAFVIGHKKAEGTLIAPEPLGNVLEEFVVESGTALAYQLKPGQKLQIVDLEGQQCSDFQAFNAKMLDKGVERMINSTATRSMVRQAFPRPGLHDKYYDDDMSPLLRVLRDTCGRHDTFSLACTARGYEDRGFPGHVNCSDNISYAMSPFGVAQRDAWPAINLFWNTWMDDSHHLQTEESWSRPGDYVVMEAMDELVCVSTACPDEIDPINGWNPTDILVRIYDENQKITRAVGYREKEESPMLTSEESAFHERLAPLTEHFATSRDLWVPVSFASTGTIEEYWACRNAVTVQDMSGLRKFDVVGPDAEKLLQLATTRDVAKLSVWRGQYTLMCDEAGTLIDDGTLFRVAPHLFRWCGGSEQSGRALQELAKETGLQVRINALRNSLPNLAIQGPKSRELMNRMCFTRPSEPAIDHLKWFGVTVARLQDRNGAPFMVSRTGYTGELGYEIFCSKSDAIEIWDAVMEAGKDLGITPMGGAALEVIRVEAGLAAANAEFAPNVNAFEAGLGFAVDLRKEAFVGKEALERAKASPSKVLKGLIFEGDDVPLHGAPVYKGERQVGVITSGTRSPTLECAIAMARLAIEHSENGTELEIGQLDGRMKRLTARVSAPAFVDPQRTRARV